MIQMGSITMRSLAVPSGGVPEEMSTCGKIGGIRAKEDLIAHKGMLDFGAHVRRSVIFMFIAFVVMFLSQGNTMDVRAANSCVIDKDGAVDPAFFSNSVMFTEIVIKEGVNATVNGNINASIPIIMEDDATLSLNGNMQTTKDVKIASRAKLTVTGNYTQKVGVFCPGGIDAEVIVGGDFSVVSEGQIWWAGETATVTIYGNFVYDTITSDYINNATWKIKGDVTCGDKQGALNLRELHLIGDKEQKLTLKRSDKVFALYMEGGSKGLNLPSYVNAEICTDADITVGENTVFDYLRVLGGRKINVTGNMKALGDVKLDGNVKLTVTGNYTQEKGVFCPGGIDTEVIIDGNFSVVSEGQVWWAGENATVTIHGNLIHDTITSDYINNATWKVKGDVTCGDKQGKLSFRELHLIGDKEQKLALKNGDTVSELYMEGGSKGLNLPSYLNAEIYTDADITVGENTIFNYLKIKGGRKINVTGNMKALGDVKLDDKAKLTITGNYTQETGVFCPGGVDAEVIVGRDFSVVSDGQIWWAGENATVTVDGDLLYNTVTSCYINRATWKVRGDVTQGPKQGALDLNKLELLTKGASVTINSGNISTLILDCGLSNFDIPNKCYDKVQATVKATFDANGGSVNSRQMLITTGEKYDQLPTASLNGKNFVGWFTAKEGGTQVTNDTDSTEVEDHILYAHWEAATEEPGNEEPGNNKPVTSVSLNKTSLTLEKGMTYQLKATIKPADATSKQLTWSSSNKTVAKVSGSGLVTAVAKGNVTITVASSDGSRKATCSIKVVNPVKAPQKLKISSVKNSKAKAIVVKWNKAKGVKGYEVEYALNKKFTNTRKSKDAKTKTSITLTKLKKNKTYYVRMRAYVNNSLGKKVYGKWSDVKKVKIEK